jgi:hypothetical protein
VGEQDDPQAGEERVRVAELRHPGALPAGEDLLRGVGLRPAVPLEDDHAGVAAGEEARDGEPGESPAEDHRRGVGVVQHRIPQDMRSVATCRGRLSFFVDG